MLDNEFSSENNVLLHPSVMAEPGRTGRRAAAHNLPEHWSDLQVGEAGVSLEEGQMGFSLLSSSSGTRGVGV
jgi:hypothetical protein